MLRHRLFQRVQALQVPIQQVQHVLLGAHRTLDAPQRVPGNQRLQPGGGLQQFLPRVGEALTEGGGLGGDVVGAPDHDPIGMGHRQLGQASQGGDAAVSHEFQGGSHLELLNVLGQVARGHALVDLLEAGQGAELLDPGLHVVPRSALPGRNAGEIDLLHDGLVGLDGAVRHSDAQVALGPKHSQPELTLQDDLVARRPKGPHGSAGVAHGEHVGDSGACSDRIGHGASAVALVLCR